MEQVKLNTLKKCELFKRNETTNIVYQRGHYIREDKSFSCTDYEDCNKEVFIKANKLVWIGFEY